MAFYLVILSQDLKINIIHYVNPKYLDVFGQKNQRHPLYIICFQIKAIKNYFSYFSTKTHVVGTH